MLEFYNNLWGQGVTKRCCLSWLTNSAFVSESKCGGMGRTAGSQPISTSMQVTWHGAQINFGDLTPYLTYVWGSRTRVGIWLSYLTARAGIFKLLRSPGIDSQRIDSASLCSLTEPKFINVLGAQVSIPPAYVAWRAGTTNRVTVPARQAS